MIRKILVTVGFFPVMLFHMMFRHRSGIYQTRNIWRYYAIPEGRLQISHDQYFNWLKQTEYFTGWLEGDISINQLSINIEREYDALLSYVEFGNNNYDRMLLFKSEADKNWFILKYL
jgi:hypothetical protein